MRTRAAGKPDGLLKQLTVKILATKPEENQVRVELLTPGRLIRSLWWLDGGDLAEWQCEMPTRGREFIRVLQPLTQFPKAVENHCPWPPTIDWKRKPHAKSSYKKL